MDILQDNDVRLRPIQLETDVSVAIKWYQDAEVLRFSEGEGTLPYSSETVSRMYHYLVQLGEVYIIEWMGNKAGQVWQPVGDVSLCKNMIPIIIGEATCRGFGIGRRVISMLIERARALGWDELMVNKVYEYNERSRRLFESLGFHCIETYFDDHGRACRRYQLKLR